MKNEPLPPKLSFACPKRWDEMQEDGPQRRFCDQCQLHVHDLSAMTEQQGQRLLAGANEHLCVSFVVRPNGTMAIRGRWDGLKRGWLAVRQTVLTLLAMVAPFAFTACHNDRNQSTTLGKVCVAPREDKKVQNVVLGRTSTVRTGGTPAIPERKAGDR